MQYLKVVRFSFIFSLIFSSGTLFASDLPNGEVPIQTLSTQTTQNLRINYFAEVMSPAFMGNTESTPLPSGMPYKPVTGYSILNATYEFAPNYQFVYWQKFATTFTSNFESQGVQFFPRVPRFALRKTSILDVSNLTTAFDFYVQPGIIQNAFWSKNYFEIGLRTNWNYAIPKSNWAVGILTEFTTAYLDPKGQGSRAYGWVNPFAIYSLNSRFSTQHWLYVPIDNPRSGRFWHFAYDDPGKPYVQNGISYKLSSGAEATLLLNNYLFTKPSWRNTWASLWLSFNLF